MGDGAQVLASAAGDREYPHTGLADGDMAIFETPIARLEIPVRIENVIPSIATDNPMDLEFGPDGALYMLEYGDGYFTANPDAQLSRIEYVELPGENRADSY